MHPLHSRAGSLDRPDYAFFDLDPFEPYTYEDVRTVAKLVRVVLDGLGLHGYAKTSGATGMQVFVPLDGTHTHTDAREFVERVGRLVVRAYPERATMAWPVADRVGKVFIDHQMNRQGANIASVYSLRPLPGAPVSTPLDWEELDTDIEPGDFRHESGFTATQRLLERENPPTAIFASSDQMALGVYEAARRRGLRVPDDLSVVGFDDLPEARWSSPPLTTVRQPFVEMGAVALRILTDLIAGRRRRREQDAVERLGVELGEAALRALGALSRR